MNRHHISMKDIVDICGLPLAYNKEDVTSKDNDLQAWLTTEKHIQSAQIFNKFNRNWCHIKNTPKIHHKNKLVRQLFIWLNLPAKDRAESACQIAYDKGDSNNGQDTFILSSASVTIPCVQKLVRALRKELNYCSIGLWEFVRKVCKLL